MNINGSVTKKSVVAELMLFLSASALWMGLTWLAVRHWRVGLGGGGEEGPGPAQENTGRILCLSATFLGVFLPMSAGALCSLKWRRSTFAWLSETFLGILCCSGYMLVFFTDIGYIKNPAWNLIVLCPLVFLLVLLLVEVRGSFVARGWFWGALSLVALVAIIPLLWTGKYSFGISAALLIPATALLPLPGLGGLFTELIRTQSWYKLPLLFASLITPGLMIGWFELICFYKN